MATLFSGCAGNGPDVSGSDNTTDSGTGIVSEETTASETAADPGSSVPAADEDRSAEPSVGTMSVTVGKDGDRLSFICPDVTFDMIFGGNQTYSLMSRRGANNIAKTSRYGEGSIDISNGKYVISNTWSDEGTKLETTVSVTDTETTVSQSISVKNGGIAGVGFGLIIPDTYNVIIPAWNGVRLSADNDKFWTGWTNRVVYGQDLQMQMFIIEGENGGALVYCADNMTAFKALEAIHSKTYFCVNAETIPQAPYTAYTSYETPEWKIIPYTGSWQNAVSIYREFAEKAFGLAEADSLRPDWTDAISLVYLTDLNSKSELNTLAKLTDPSTVLLQVPGWRAEEYDVNWPDYTPNDTIVGMIEYAHSLGFKVQLHVNMNGCQTTMDEYKLVSKYHIKNDLNGDKRYAEYTAAGKTYKFAYINPASEEWRELMIDKLKTLIEVTNADAIHLDESFFAFNDANGLVGGMTSLQGNVLYHKQLAEAFDGKIAIGGESINECNAIYGTFLQTHGYSTDGSNESWSNSMFEQIVPLTESVYYNVKNYEWAGLPITDKEEYYLSWVIAGVSINTLPTLMRESVSSLTSSANDAMLDTLARAEWYAEYNPVSVYYGWDDNTIMRWKLNDGRFAQCRRTGYGLVILKDENDEDSVLTKLVYGASYAETEGVITDWYAYDENGILGLDPDSIYPVREGEPEAGKVIVSAISDKSAYFTVFENEEKYLKFALSSPSGGSTEVILTLEREVKSVICSGEYTVSGNRVTLETELPGEVYIIYAGGDEITLPYSLYGLKPQAVVYDTAGNIVSSSTAMKNTASVAGVQSKNLVADLRSGKITELDCILFLPEAEVLTLSGRVGSNDSAPGFKAEISVNGRTMWTGKVESADEAPEFNVDLSGFAGQAVLIKFAVSGSSYNGKALWCGLTVK